MKKISIIAPIYNEEETIPEFYNRLMIVLQKDFSCFLYEIILVDDGSTDQSAYILKKLSEQNECVKSIIFSRNFGHHIAISAGLDHATGDYVVMMDSDLQDQPENIKFLYHKLVEGFDVVYGDRLNKKFDFLKRSYSALFIAFMKSLMREKIEINTTIFRIMTKQVADEVIRLRESQRYLVGVIGWVGFKHTSVSVEHGIRKYGTTKYSFLKQFSLACNAIFSFSEYPLRLITVLGFMFMTLSFILVGYIIIRYFFQSLSVQGWTSLIAAILFMGGIQLLVLGIMGEYLGRLYIEIKHRPLYVIKHFFNKNTVNNMDFLKEKTDAKYFHNRYI